MSRARKYKKMTLVSEDELDRLREKAIRDYNPALKTLSDIQQHMDKVLVNRNLSPETQVQLLGLLQDRFHTLYANAKSAGLLGNQPSIAVFNLTQPGSEKVVTPAAGPPLEAEAGGPVPIENAADPDDTIGEPDPLAGPKIGRKLPQVEGIGARGAENPDLADEEFLDPIGHLAASVQETPGAAAAPLRKPSKKAARHGQERSGPPEATATPKHQKTSPKKTKSLTKEAAIAPIRLPNPDDLGIPEKFHDAYLQMSRELHAHPERFNVGKAGEVVLSGKVFPNSNISEILKRLYVKPPKDRGQFITGEQDFITNLAKIGLDPNLVGVEGTKLSMLDAQRRLVEGSHRTRSLQGDGKRKRRHKSDVPPGKPARLLKLYNVTL